MSVVKKQRWVPVITALITLNICTDALAYAWPSNTRNDPFPVHTSVDPQYFLYEREKQLMFGMPDAKGTPERVMVSLCPFGQNADVAKRIDGHYSPAVINSCDPVTCNLTFQGSCQLCSNAIPIGDIDGRWNLLGLLAGEIPAGVTIPPLLETAFGTLFPGIEPGDVTTSMIQITSNLPCTPTFGYVSVPLKYRKKGIRWDVEAQICGDLGLQFLGGVVEISQVLNPCFENLTAGDSVSNCSGTQTFTSSDVNCVLFDQLVPLMNQLGLNVCNFTKWGVEDLYLALYWRHAHIVNFNRDLSWPRVLVIPFARFGGSVATGHEKDPSVQFSLPFGNNGSNSIDISAGMNFDFAETIEIGAEFGYAHFFSKEFSNYRAPTDVLQSGIFPWTTPARVQPGDSAYVAGKLAAYHFLDRLSFYFQWVFINHRNDHVELIAPDPAFLSLDDTNPGAKCPNTAWRVQLGNIAFTYDISPNFAIGFFWQQMFHIRNAYNSVTSLFTLNMIF